MSQNHFLKFPLKWPFGGEAHHSLSPQEDIERGSAPPFVCEGSKGATPPVTNQIMRVKGALTMSVVASWQLVPPVESKIADIPSPM